MELFPLLIFLFIGWTIFKNVKAAGEGIEKSVKSSSDLQTRLKNYAEQNEFEVSPDSKEDWSFDKTPTQRGRETLQRRLEAASKQQAFKKKPARKYKPSDIGVGKDFGLNSRHAPQKDQNRHRRDDWGARGGTEIMSTKNILVLLAVGFIVLYVLSKVSISDLGF